MSHRLINYYICCVSASRMCPKGDDPLTTSQNSRVITITTGAASGTLAGMIGITFDGITTTMDASAAAAGDTACTTSLSNLDNVQIVSCSRGTPDSQNGAVYTITFSAFPTNPEQNNFFSHDGNPPIASFTCDISAVTGADTPTCTIADSVSSNIQEYEMCSRRGICNTETGVCACYAAYSGLACESSSAAITSSDSNDVLTLQAEASAYEGRVLHMKTGKQNNA